MKKGLMFVTVVVLGGLLSQGCDNIGKAPGGPSAEELKQHFDKMPLEQHVQEIKKGSAPNDIKKAAIEKLYKEAGKEVPPGTLDDLSGNAPVSGAPAASGAPTK